MITRRRRNQIRLKVENLLNEQQILHPRIDVAQLARQHRIQIKVQPIDEESISGFLVRQRGKAEAIIGVNSTHAENRQRFTIAHELGHFFLHGSQGQEEVHVDHEFQIKFRDPASSQGVNDEEMEANFFAAELLMPTMFLERDVTEHGGMDLATDDDEAVAKLAMRYGVSKQAMSIRLGQLSWLSSL